ncbi:MAG: glycosyltransferase [Isosphaeraceae bacterium]
MQSLTQRLATAAQRPWPEHPVRIALVITELDVGGAEKAMVSLAEGLDRRRWSPHVIALGPEGVLAARLRGAGISCECLGAGRGQPVRLLRRLIRAFRRLRPELVQSFLFHANISSRLAAPWAGSPWVVGGLRVAERRGSRRWHLLLDRLTGRLAAGSVCVSEGVRAFSVREGRLSPGRLTVIPNGIDPRPYDSAAAVPREGLGVPRGAELCLAVGRLDPQKGIADLLAAAERVIPLCPTWHLALAGDGPSRGWLLEQLRQRPALGGRVHWLGPRRDVPGLLKAADYLVLASHWEGMPNVVLEAMAAGLPVVATTVEGTEELVVPGETGWLVPPREPEVLARALLDAASSRERRLLMGEAGRRRAGGFSMARVVAAYERLWAGLLGFPLDRD